MKITPLWRTPWLLCVAGFCGVMFASAVTAATPGSALWASRFLCHGGAHLSDHAANTSFGTTTQSTISFSCVDAAGHIAAVSTGGIFLAQLLLGTLVTYGVLYAIAGLRRTIWVAPA